MKGTQLEKFFREKDIPYKSFDIKDATGLSHMVDTEIIIETILTSLQPSDKDKVAEKLGKLDFANASTAEFHRFLEYVMKGFIDIYY